jgi:integrase
VPKLDEKTRAQKVDRESGLPMWTVSLYGRGRAAGKRWRAVFNVTVVSTEKPLAEEGEQVVPLYLEALPWVSEQNGKARNVRRSRPPALRWCPRPSGPPPNSRTGSCSLLDAGESVKALSAYLGHSDAGFTLRIYTHLLPASEDRTSRAIDHAFANDPETSDGLETA